MDAAILHSEPQQSQGLHNPAQQQSTLLITNGD